MNDLPLITDAHVHFWNPDRVNYFWLTPQLERLNRAILPPDLKPELLANRVSKVVLVQASHDPKENAFMLTLARENPFIAGVVGWLDLESVSLEKELDTLTQTSIFRGLRHLVHTESDLYWLLRKTVQRGLLALEKHGLSFDLVLRQDQWDAALVVAELYPNLVLILDHLGSPPQDELGLMLWREWLRELATQPNVYAKFSGLTNHPFLTQIATDALELLGTNRLMFGSDSPIATALGDYRQNLEVSQKLFPPDLTDFWGRTAERAYRLTEVKNETV